MCKDEYVQGGRMLEYDFQGRRFIIRHDSVILVARYANARRFVWEISGKEVSPQEWLDCYKQWDPGIIFHGDMVLGANYEQAYQDNNYLGAMAVAHVAAELGLVDQMCQSVTGSVWHNDLLLMKPTEAFERFGLAEEGEQEEAESTTSSTHQDNSDSTSNQPSISGAPTTPKSKLFNLVARALGRGVKSVAAEPKAGTLLTLTIAGVAVNFHWAPAGTFMMGSPESEKVDQGGIMKHLGSERQHAVTLTKGFWIAETSTTQELWQAVMRHNPSYFQSSNQLPVEQLSWYDCQDFVEKLNLDYSSALPSGYQYAMPTEAQWEYACRAGTTTTYNLGSDLNCDMANCWRDPPSGTSETDAVKHETRPVKSYAPNAWGLYDMHGNVWDWCADWWGGYEMSSTALVDPTGPEFGTIRIMRGGSWYNYPEACRSAYRGYAPADRGGHVQGFRLVLVR